MLKDYEQLKAKYKKAEENMNSWMPDRVELEEEWTGAVKAKDQDVLRQIINEKGRLDQALGFLTDAQYFVVDEFVLYVILKERHRELELQNPSDC